MARLTVLDGSEVTDLRSGLVAALVNAGWQVDEEPSLGVVRPDLLATGASGITVVGAMGIVGVPVHFATIAQLGAFRSVVEKTHEPELVRAVIFSTVSSDHVVRSAAAAATVVIVSSADIAGVAPTDPEPEAVIRAWAAALEPWRARLANYRREVFEVVRSHLASELDLDINLIEEISNLRLDLGADSLDLYTLIEELQDQYGLRVDDEEAVRLATVGSVVDYISTNRAAPIVEAEAKRIIDAFDESPESHKGRALLSAYDEFTERAAAAVGDVPAAELTFAQFASGAAMLTSTEFGARILGAGISAIVALGDRSNAGYIRRREFARWMQAVDVSELDAKQLFDRLDELGRGRLTADQLAKAAIRQRMKLAISPLGNSVLTLS